MKSFIRTLQIAFTYIGTIVGAGFATGQEILQFFTRYGYYSVPAILLSSLIMMWLGTKMMLIAKRVGARSYEDFNRHLFGDRAGSLISLFTLVILLGVNSIMLAGAGAIFQEHLGFHYQTGLIVTIAGSFFLLRRGIKGILQMNSIVVPLMITLSLVVVFHTVHLPGAGRFLLQSTDYSPLRAWLSPLLYTAFNLGMAQAVLVPLASHTESERSLKIGGILGGAGIGCMLLAANFAMSAYMPGIRQFEIPMGAIALKLGAIVQLIYLMLIFMEIFTTFVADMYGVTAQLKHRLPFQPQLITLVVMVFCYSLSQFGFSSLLSLLYPIFGAFSLIWLVRLGRSPGNPPPGSYTSSQQTGPFLPHHAVDPVPRAKRK